MKTKIRKFIKPKITSISFIMAFFKVFGLAPFKMVLPKCNSEKYPRISLRYSTKGSIYSFLLSIPNIALLMRLLINYSTITPKLVLRKLVIINLAWITSVILWYYCFKQEAYIEILNKLLKLEYDLIKQFNRSVSRCKNKSYEIISFITEVVLMMIQMIPFIDEARADNDFWMAIVVTSGFIINILMLQYTMLINFMNKRLNYMNELLLSVTEIDSSGKRCSDLMFIKSSVHNGLILSTITLVREYQRKLFGIFKDLSHFYSWPILLAMVLFCIRLILYSYKFTKRLIFHSNKIALMSFVCEPASLIKEIFIIMIFTNQMTQITAEIRKTGEIIFKVMDAYSTHGGIQSELEQFSMEILHRRIPNSVFGLFKINGLLVTSIAQSMITYLVILIQFNYNLDLH